MDDLREFKAFGAHIVSSAARRITVAKVNRVPQAAIESIQRWSEFHQKQDMTTNDPAYMPVVIKACYAVFDYPLGWLVDITVGNIRSIAFPRTPYRMASTERSSGIARPWQSRQRNVDPSTQMHSDASV